MEELPPQLETRVFHRDPLPVIIRLSLPPPIPIGPVTASQIRLGLRRTVESVVPETSRGHSLDLVAVVELSGPEHPSGSVFEDPFVPLPVGGHEEDVAKGVSVVDELAVGQFSRLGFVEDPVAEGGGLGENEIVVLQEPGCELLQFDLVLVSDAEVEVVVPGNEAAVSHQAKGGAS